MGLRNSLKIFKRDIQQTKAKNSTAAANNVTTEPPSKRAKIYSDDEDQIDDDAYMEELEQLQILGKHKKSGNHKEVKHLMELTKLRRHQWIREERPLVFDVVKKFPCLATNKWVSDVF